MVRAVAAVVRGHRAALLSAAAVPMWTAIQITVIGRADKFRECARPYFKPFTPGSARVVVHDSVDTG